MLPDQLAAVIWSHCQPTIAQYKTFVWLVLFLWVNGKFEQSLDQLDNVNKSMANAICVVSINNVFRMHLSLQTYLENTYRKVASSRLFRLVAHPRIFRLFMKRRFDPKGPKLNSSLVCCSRLYGSYNFCSESDVHPTVVYGNPWCPRGIE